MKKKYVTPLSTNIAMHVEGMIAASSGENMPVDDETIDDPANIGTQRKRGFGPPLWSSDEEEL